MICWHFLYVRTNFVCENDACMCVPEEPVCLIFFFNFSLFFNSTLVTERRGFFCWLGKILLLVFFCCCYCCCSSRNDFLFSHCSSSRFFVHCLFYPPSLDFLGVVPPTTTCLRTVSSILQVSSSWLINQIHTQAREHTHTHTLR